LRLVRAHPLDEFGRYRRRAEAESFAVALQPEPSRLDLAQEFG
jgi:hypothetical protein